MKNSSVSHAHVSCRLKVYNFSSFFPKDLRPPDPQGEHLRVHSCPVIFKTFKNPPGSTTETLHYELASVSSTITQELIDHACAKINHDPGKMTQKYCIFFPFILQIRGATPGVLLFHSSAYTPVFCPSTSTLLNNRNRAVFFTVALIIWFQRHA